MFRNQIGRPAEYCTTVKTHTSPYCGDPGGLEFTREDLVTALNEMVLEYKKLSQPFEEVKAKRGSYATNTELVSSKDMQPALSKLETENEKLRSRTEEMICENQ
ncbi:hypothetical protein F511_01167 [Dorcoceras hygrometricum]|uniref:Uncharacterized protein n=1 Tax=Dorcoceras hygrometricum TaxID=472368 RepID=A0A2Z7C2W5_9LAMI|nr:hypothetical protein F511_01167 [Dorcoceras hygrometricum]